MRDCVTQSVSNNVRLVVLGITHEMSYTADSIPDSIRIRIVTPDSIRTQTADSQVPRVKTANATSQLPKTCIQK